MFTLVPRPDILDHRDRRSSSVEPIPTVIDHRQVKHTGKKNLSYETIKEHRDALILSEFQYKRRIKELEKENEELVKIYEPTYEENKSLKSHILSGPEVQKIKKLKKEKKELLSEIEIIKQENAELTDRVHELEKMFISEKNYYLEKKWREAVEKGRKRREETEAGMAVQGPFSYSSKQKKRNIKSVKDEEFESQDEYDLHIDSLEKETQILLNKIQQIKQNKENIDYVNFIGKGAVTRNAVIANAINEKLDRDLISFEERLEHLRKKAKTLNIQADVKPIKSLSSDEAEREPKQEKKTQSKNTGNKYFRSKLTQTDAIDEKDTTEEKKIVARTFKAKSANTKDIKTFYTSTDGNGRTPSSKKRKDSACFTKSDNIKNVTDQINLKQNIDSKVVILHSSTGKRNEVSTKKGINTESKVLDKPGPITAAEEHWGHLASKLTETEKYGKSKKSGKRQQSNNRNAPKINVNYQTTEVSNSANQHIRNKQDEKLREKLTPVSLMSETANATRSRLGSGRSQGSILPDETSDMSHIDAKRAANDTSERAVAKVNSALKVRRKTSNTGELIRFIPTNQYFDTNSGNRNTRDQIGRYSNGPEPIRKKETANERIEIPEKVNSDNKEIKENVRNTVQNSDLHIRKDRSNSLKPRTKQTPQQYVQNPSNMSAYDEVLADMQKKYKDQTTTMQKKYLDSGSLF